MSILSCLQYRTKEFPHTIISIDLPSFDKHLFQLELPINEFIGIINLVHIKKYEVQEFMTLEHSKDKPNINKIYHSTTISIVNGKELHVMIAILVFETNIINVSIITCPTPIITSLFHPDDERSKLNVKLPTEGKTITIPDYTDIVD